MKTNILYKAPLAEATKDLVAEAQAIMEGGGFTVPKEMLEAAARKILHENNPS